MIFTIDEEEYEKGEAWIKEHNNTHTRDKSAIGGRYAYHFCPTSIGMVISVTCACGASFDMSGDL